VAILVGAITCLKPVLRAFAKLGSDGLTLDELKALDMLDKIKVPLEPTELNGLGWMMMAVPLGMISFPVMRDWILGIGKPVPSPKPATYYLCCALMGASVALAVLFEEAGPRTIFLCCMVAAAYALHAEIEDVLVVRAGRLIVVGLMSAGLIGLRSSSWTLVSVSLAVMALGLTTLLLYLDLQKPGESAASEATLDAQRLFLGVVGIAASIAIIVQTWRAVP